MDLDAQTLEKGARGEINEFRSESAVGGVVSTDPALMTEREPLMGPAMSPLDPLEALDDLERGMVLHDLAGSKDPVPRR